MELPARTAGGWPAQREELAPGRVPRWIPRSREGSHRPGQGPRVPSLTWSRRSRRQSGAEQNPRRPMAAGATAVPEGSRRRRRGSAGESGPGASPAPQVPAPPRGTRPAGRRCRPARPRSPPCPGPRRAAPRPRELRGCPSEAAGGTEHSRHRARSQRELPGLGMCRC